jgi:hypothetical protein
MQRPELNVDWDKGINSYCQGCGQTTKLAKICPQQLEEYYFCSQCIDAHALSQWKEYAIYLESLQTVVKRAGSDKQNKLFLPAEWRAARGEHYKHNPEKGHYWWAEHFNPVLVVLAVLPSHVVVSRKTVVRGEVYNDWSWDVSKCDLVSRKDFVDLLERSHAELSDCKHLQAVKEFEGLATQPENAV